MKHPLRYIALLTGATALCPVGGPVFAAGPFPYDGTEVHLPYDGDGLGSGKGFTIDHAAFDRSDVTAAPCPVNATCTNMTATSADDNFLMREVHDLGSGNRYLQTIFAESDAVEGDFIFESAVSSQNAPIYEEDQGAGGQIGSKHVIDAPDTGRGSFFLSFAMYQGYEHFGNNYDYGEHPWVDVTQIVDGFQTFTMRGLIGNEDTPQQFIGTRLQIVQDGAGNMPTFGHILGWAPSGTTLVIGDQALESTGGALTATWIGSAMSGGGPGLDTLAAGQTQNHDARLAEQRDFGLLIYRHANHPFLGTTGNAGGTPNGLLNPQFTQGNPGAMLNIIEIRGFSLQADQNDSGVFSNLGHGAFVGGSDMLSNYWDDSVFGPNPY